ncbi:hypothetical protein ACI2KR_06390 [Pseudomonas luteola]
MSLFDTQKYTSEIEAARCALAEMADELIMSPSESPLTRDTWRSLPAKPGVYLIYAGQTMIYVGESGSLQGRAKDLFRTVNHSFRRELGKKLYGDRPNFVPATSSRKFVDEIEAELTAHMESRLTFKAMVVEVGRKEVEEHICERIKTGMLMNKRKRRR